MVTDSSRPPAVVLIHHFGGSRSTWAAVMDRLGAGCVCVAADLRGFGGGDGRGAPLTVEAYADDVIGRCDALGLGRLIIVGHSMGGRVAMAVAAREPARVAGLVLLAPSPPTPEPMTDGGRASLAAAREDRFAAGRQVSHITGGPLSADRKAAAVDDVVAADPAAWRAWVEVGSRQDLSALVRAITCPVTVLSGDRDAAIPTAVVEREVVARLPQATLVRVPGAGHLLPIEAPDAVVAAIVGLRPTPPPVASVRDLIDTDAVTPPTRRVLQERAAWRSQGPQFLTADEILTLTAVCDAMIPQDGADDPGGPRYRVDLAGEIDRRLAGGTGNGWRYAALPDDCESYRRGLAALDDVAGRRPGRRYHELSRPHRLAILTDLRGGAGDGPAWRTRGLDPKLLLEEWLAEAVEIYYSHPGGGIADLAYVGFADARGWRRVGLDQLEPQERLFPAPGQPSSQGSSAATA